MTRFTGDRKPPLPTLCGGDGGYSRRRASARPCRRNAPFSRLALREAAQDLGSSTAVVALRLTPPTSAVPYARFIPVGEQHGALACCVDVTLLSPGRQQSHIHTQRLRGDQAMCPCLRKCWDPGIPGHLRKFRENYPTAARVGQRSLMSYDRFHDSPSPKAVKSGKPDVSESRASRDTRHNRLVMLMIAKTFPFT